MSKTDKEPIGQCYKCGANLYATLGLCLSCENKELCDRLELEQRDLAIMTGNYKTHAKLNEDYQAKIEQLEALYSAATKALDSQIETLNSQFEINSKLQDKIKQLQADLDKESIEHLQIQQETEKAFTKQLEQLINRCGEIGAERDVALGELEQQQEAIRTLLALIKEAHSEGYGDGGVSDSSIIDENDWATHWNESASKKVVDEAEATLKPETPKERAK